jgi:hypothetical protein
MKHTALASFSSTAWEITGWTTVHSGIVTPGLGWKTFNFNTPFAYNGTSNLLIDFSFNNAAPGTSGSVRSYAGGTSRVLHFSSNSLHGDPLSWTGSTPAGSLSTNVPHLKLASKLPTVGVVPSAVFLTDGTWTGSLRVPHGNTNINITAADAIEGTGVSNSFAVNAPADGDTDGLPDDWESAHSLATGNASGDNGPFGDPDRDGISNLLEHAFDLNPRESDDSGPLFPEARIHPADGKRYLELTYHRRIGASWLEYLVETSSDCLSWSAEPGAYQQIRAIPLGENPQAEAITIRILPAIDAPGSPARFARVRVLVP